MYSYCKGKYIYVFTSLRSKRFRGVWEQRKTEERDFRCFSRAKNGARAKKRKREVGEGNEGAIPLFPLFGSRTIFRAGKTPKIPFLWLSLLPNPTETLATQAMFSQTYVANLHIALFSTSPATQLQFTANSFRSINNTYNNNLIISIIIITPHFIDFPSLVQVDLTDYYVGIKTRYFKICGNH